MNKDPSLSDKNSTIKSISNKDKGDTFEFEVLNNIKDYGLKVNGIRTNYYVNNKLYFIGDGGTDLIASMKSYNLFVQCKFRSNSNVEPIDIREFIGNLTTQSKNSIGLFVTNSKYSIRAINEHKNSEYNDRLYLTTDKDLIKTLDMISNDIEKKNNELLLNDNHYKEIVIDFLSGSEITFLNGVVIKNFEMKNVNIKK